MHPALLSRPAFARWGIVVLLMVWTGLGHFCRIGISVAGEEVFMVKGGISGADGNKTGSSEEPSAVADGKEAGSETKNASVATMKDSIDEKSMGWVYTAFLIVYTGMMIPGGWLIDRIGAARALTWLGLSMGLFVALTGVVGWVTKNPYQLWIMLLVIRSFAGLCSAPLHPASAHVVADVTNESGRSTANGLVTAGALIGIALTQPVFGAMIEAIRWQWAFIAAGSALFLYGLIWGFSVAPKLPGGRHTGNVNTAVDVDPEAEIPQSRPHEIWQVLGRREIWLVTLSYALYSYFQYLFFYWMGRYFKEVLHIPVIEARNATCLVLLAMGAGMAVGGMATDLMCRLVGPTSGRRAIAMSGLGLASLFVYIAIQCTSNSMVILFIAFSMASLGMCEGVFWTSATDFGGKARGFAGAFMNAGGNVGGFISPVLSPYIADKFGWAGAIKVACVVAAVGAVIWLVIRMPDPVTTREGLLALEEDGVKG